MPAQKITSYTRTKKRPPVTAARERALAEAALAAPLSGGTKNAGGVVVVCGVGCAFFIDFFFFTLFTNQLNVYALG